MEQWLSQGRERVCEGGFFVRRFNQGVFKRGDWGMGGGALVVPLGTQRAFARVGMHWDAIDPVGEGGEEAMYAFEAARGDGTTVVVVICCGGGLMFYREGGKRLVVAPKQGVALDESTVSVGSVPASAIL